MANDKVKNLIRITFTVTAVIYFAFIGFLQLNMYKVNVTKEIDRLNWLLIFAIIIALLIRIFKNTRLTSFSIIIGDIFLIIMAFGHEGRIIETLKHSLTEPAIIMLIAGTAIIIWDWKIRIKKLAGNKS